MPPRVSIITATYHRPEVLAYAIRAVLTQTHTDWELLVMGDHCTDHTEATVRRFEDPRVQFINLPENCGEQSGPNNEGLRRARGQYIAFVNHDDLWFPDHLARALETLEATGADLVFAPGLAVQPGGGLRIVGLAASEHYEPNVFVGASSWVFRRELLESVGEWRNFRQCYLVPSQDWLFRAWRRGADIRMLPEINWLAIMSGLRKGSYTTASGAQEHAHWFDRMRNEPALREEAAALLLPAAQAQLDAHPLRHPIRALRRAANRLLFRVGLNSMMLRALLRHGTPGGYIRHMRAVRGLPEK